KKARARALMIGGGVVVALALGAGAVVGVKAALASSLRSSVREAAKKDFAAALQMTGNKWYASSSLLATLRQETLQAWFDAGKEQKDAGNYLEACKEFRALRDAAKGDDPSLAETCDGERQDAGAKHFEKLRGDKAFADALAWAGSADWAPANRGQLEAGVKTD